MKKIIPKQLPDGRWLVSARRPAHGLARVRKKFNTKKQADDFISSLTAPPPAPTVKAHLDLATVWSEYIRYAEHIQGKSPHTIRVDVGRMKVFIAWTQAEGIRLCDITSDIIRRFQEYYFANAPFPQANHKTRPQGKPSASTWEKYRQIISTFFNWCKKRHIIDENPVTDSEFKIKTQQKMPDIFAPDEIKKMLDWLDRYGPDYPMPVAMAFRILAYTGMRLGEMMNLKWRDIDLDNGLIKITKSKSRKIRTVPIHPEIADRLATMPTRSLTYVMDSGKGDPIFSDSWYWKVWRQAAIETGVPPRPIHALRHTFAATLVMAGVDIVTVKELLGHSDIRTTMVYLHFSPAHAKDAIAKLPY